MYKNLLQSFDEKCAKTFCKVLEDESGPELISLNEAEAAHLQLLLCTWDGNTGFNPIIYAFNIVVEI